MYVKYIQIFKSLEECYDQVRERERERLLLDVTCT